MDKVSYLEIKRREASQTPIFKREKMCYTCYWLQEHCRCSLIHPFATQTRFVILMHIMEAKQEKLGTGRISNAVLPNSEIIVGIDFTENQRVNSILHDPENYCMVLYPGDQSLNISKEDITPLLEKKKSGRNLVVFLIDGTWTCAKKMMTQSLNIRRLPRLSFSASHESIFHIKEQPAAYCLSTLESIHCFLSEADRRGLEHLPGRPQDNLIHVFESMIQFMKDCALDPAKAGYRRGPRNGYSDPKTRSKRKPTSGRNIVLVD